MHHLTEWVWSWDTNFPKGEMYFSQNLSSAECNHTQIVKDRLAIVKGVKKFHDYVYD